ncbi:sigma 54-interacting transcriptional regulator [Escherichia albertii]|nr:sigma 54-interacting transcriptional regulator [Escherichia albertii]
MSRQPVICIISPLKALSQHAEALFYRYQGKATISVINAHLDDLNAALPAIKLQNPDVIVSRGGMAWMLKKMVYVPVVEIKTSGYDILDALSPWMGQDKNIGVIGFRSVIEGCTKIADTLGLKLAEFIIDEMDVPCINSVRQDFQRYMNNNQLDLIIGDAICPIYFGRDAQQFIPFNSGLGSIEQALDDAIQLSTALLQERIEQLQLNLLLDHTEKSVVMLTPQGTVMRCNHRATRLLGLKKQVRLNDVLPNLELDWAHLSQGDIVENELIASPLGELVMNQYPIVEQGLVNRVIVTFQTSSSLQGTEQTIRLKEVKKLSFQARYRFNDFITHDEEMRTRLLLAKTYAVTEATMLILGENGTGKEIIAQSIHNASLRKDGPFVAVNCGAIPAPILESELFGYVDGAFSGAAKKGKTGLFELAHNGTLFLDEICELDKYLQAKLLRVLQERRLMRLGSDHMIPIDIRIVAATNRNIPAMIAEGEFREDLYYRLNVLKITTLPLRDRPCDIRVIGEARLNELRDHYHMLPIQLSDALWDFLRHYDWPGNVRQLGNIMERLALSFREGVIDLPDTELFLEDLKTETCIMPESDAEQQAASSGCSSCQMLEGSYKHIRSRILKAVMIRQENNKSSAARQLNIDRSSLNRWLEEQA